MLIIELLFLALDDCCELNRLLSLHFFGEKGTLVDNSDDRILTSLIGDLLRNQCPVSLEFHINVKVDPFVSDFSCHKRHLASLRIFTATP